MRTERRVGLKWVYLTLVALVVAVAVIHATAQTSRAEGEEKAAAAEGQRAERRIVLGLGD